MFLSDLPLKFSYIHPTVGGCFRCSKIACALYFVVCFCFCVTFSMLAARLFTRYRTCFFWDRHENLLTQAYACYTVNIVHSLRCGSTQTPFGAKRSLSLFNLVKSKWILCISLLLWNVSHQIAKCIGKRKRRLFLAPHNTHDFQCLYLTRISMHAVFGGVMYWNTILMPFDTIVCACFFLSVSTNVCAVYRYDIQNSGWCC